MNRIDRLFGIVLRLQRRKTVRAQDLAAHFAVSERTIYRDIAALSAVGVPIIAVPNVGYALPEGFALPPLFFTSGEAGAVALAIQLLLAQTTGTTSQDAERALAKITVMLPRELRSQIDARSAIIHFYATDRPFDLDDPRLGLLHQAIVEQRVVALQYHSYHRGEQRAREIEPATLTYHQGVWYVNAYCRLRQAPRSFRLDRIDALHLGATTFSLRSDRAPVDEAVRVQICFTPSIIRWVHERQHFGYVAEEGAVMHYAVTDPQEMLPWILSWGAQAEVVEPATLRAQIRDEARKLLEILT